MSYPREELALILEGILFAAAKPLTVEQLQKLFVGDEQPAIKELREALVFLAEHYAERSVNLNELATGYQFQVVERIAPWLHILWQEKPARYTRATLETLALIAYRQPITRGEIENVRGVAVSTQIIKSLIDREWIRVVGHKDVPGRPSLYATTKQFLEYFNLKNLDDLPPLADIQDLDKVSEELVAVEVELRDAVDRDELTPESVAIDTFERAVTEKEVLAETTEIETDEIMEIV